MGNSINKDKYVGIGLRGIIAPSIDPSAAAFFSATGITGATQQSAVDALVKGLKADGLWSKMKAVYPFVTDNRNLLSYTEFLGQLAYWTRSNVSVANDSTIAPNGTLTAETITSNSSVTASLNQLNLANAAGTYTQSFYVKDGYSGWVCLYTNSGTMANCSAGWFNLTTGTVGSVTSVGSFSGTTSTMTNVGNGWYRCSITFTKPLTANSTFSITAAADNSFATNIGGYIYAWGAQLELGALTTYQPILTTQQAYIAAQFKYNLVNPVDSDAAFRLVFNGGWTHSSTGATPNGTNGYADTKLVPSSNLTINNQSYSVYSRSNTAAGNKRELSVSNAGEIGILIKYSGDLFYPIIGAGTYPTSANTDSRGFFIANRTDGTNIKGYKNGSLVVNSAQIANLPSSQPVYLSAKNNGGTAIEFSDRQLAISTIGDGLTDTEAANLYSRVNTFQVALSRNV
jgi:hypothetical protein